MSKRTLSFASLLCFATIAAFGQSSYIFEVPGANTGTTQILALGDNDNTRFLGPKDVAAGAFRVLALPDGSGFYIISPSGVQAATPNLLNLTTLSGISGVVRDAAMSPDGKYVLVVGDHFYVITTATNTVTIADNALPSGGLAADVAFSPNSQTAWVLANTPGGGSGIEAISLNPFQTGGQILFLPFTATSLTLSPLGFLYVVYQADRVDEIDPSTLTVTLSGHMRIPGGYVTGRLHFTPDGTAAYSSNAVACLISNCFSIFQLNPANHTFTGVPFDPNVPAPVFDDILVGGSGKIFALSTSGTIIGPKLWDITPSPLSLTPSLLSIGVNLAGIQAAAISNERPSPRFLYVLNTDLNRPLIRVGLTDTTIVPSSPYVGQSLSFAAIPAQAGNAASAFALNRTQTVGSGGTSAPLIAYVTDIFGRPVYRQQICFSADSPAGPTVANPSQLTNADGRVQTVVTAPTTQGAYTVTLGVGSCGAAAPLTSYTVNVGISSNPSSSQMSVYTGDGQLITQSSPAPQPIMVKISNANGTGIAGIPVSFTITQGPGILFNDLTINGATTDENGLASVRFTTGFVPQDRAFVATTINAFSAYGSIDFIETTHNALLDDPQPTVTTNNVSEIQIAQGEVQPAKFTARTVAGKFPQAGAPIPNIGIRLTDSLGNPSTIAGCVGSSRGDDQGVSRCDIIGFCQPAGTSFPKIAQVLASVGERSSYPILVTLTEGTASRLAIKSTDPQTGSSGSSFTLLAQVTDGCGQPVRNATVSWSVSGSASLSQVSTISAPDGTVSARLTLGNTPGQVLVTLSAGTLTPVVFHVTNAVSIASITAQLPLPQPVVISQAFSPLIFVVRDANNVPLPNITVNFSLSGSGSGSASVNSSATTNGLGQAQANVTAGPTAGSILVTATSGGFTGTATLTSIVPGPQFTNTSFTNAASGAQGLTPCGLVTLTGNGITSGVQGVVSGVSFFGGLPYTLAGLSITVNSVPAPIHSVANDQFGQRANFQAPCELTGTSATVVVTVNGSSTSVSNVKVQSVQPGIFTFTGPGNKLYGGVIRAVDGTYVTSTNPARRGERVYVVVTGFGQVTPTIATNSAGTGSQNTLLPVLIFLNDTPIGANSARYLFGAVGAYLVEFTIPANAPVGADQRLLVIATSTNGNDFVGVSNTVLLPAIQ